MAHATVTVDTAGTLMLAVHDVTGDNIINSAEQTNGFTITGDTGAVADATVTVTLDGHSVGMATSATCPGRQRGRLVGARARARRRTSPTPARP